MQFLGCLAGLLLFFLILGLSLVGSVVRGLLSLFSPQQKPRRTSFEEKPGLSKPPSSSDYIIRSDEGEYIDYEDV